MLETQKVVSFPVHNIRCSNCESAYVGTFGIHCGEYNEEIIREEIALECEAFKPY